MGRENRWLTVVLSVLAVAVVITSGVAAYLALTRAREGGQAVAVVGGDQMINVTEDVADDPPDASVEDESPVVSAGDEAAGDMMGNTAGEWRIAFVSDQEGHVAVYVMDADGSNRQRISKDGLRFCLYPAWSPEGERIAYWGTDETTYRREDVIAGVWVSAADGSEHIRINQDVSLVRHVPSPIWSPDGTRLAFVGARDSGGEGDADLAIYIAWADGSGIKRGIPIPFEAQVLAWSPASDDLLLVSKTQDDGSAYLWSSTTEQIVRVFQHAEAADWSPGGREFVVGDIAGQEISIVEPDGGTRPVIGVDRGIPVQVSWSPDGSQVAVGIALRRRRGRSFSTYFSTSLYIVNLETGKAATVSENQGRIHRLGWSRDGGHVLFTLVDFGVRSGAEVPWANLWDYDTASGQLEQITDEDGFVGFGVWSP